MKSAEQWYAEGGLNNDAAEIQHRREIQLDALNQARSLYVPDGNPEVWADKLDALIHELEIKPAAR